MPPLPPPVLPPVMPVATLGLSTYRWNNNIKSIVLLLLFPVLLVTLMGGIAYGCSWLFIDPVNHAVNPSLYYMLHMTPPSQMAHPENFAEAVMISYWPIMIGVAAVWTLIGYFFNDSMIHLATGAQQVERKDQPKLYNILENLCISRGMNTPMLYVIDGDEMNAYASGIDERSYAITVTRGLLTTLDDHEMESVLAHELTHIINRDCRLMIVAIVFTGMISFLAQLLWRSLRVVSYVRSDDREGGGGIILVMLISAVAATLGWGLAVLLRLAISRRREYLADAGSVELTKNPEALIGALRKISCNCGVPHVPSEVSQMFIENPPSIFDLGGLFATHPPIADRIKVLEQLGGLPHQAKSMVPES